MSVFSAWPSSLTVAQPWLLLLLLLVPLFWIKKHHEVLSPKRFFLIKLFVSLAYAFIIFSLVDVRLAWSSNAIKVVLVTETLPPPTHQKLRKMLDNQIQSLSNHEKSNLLRSDAKDLAMAQHLLLSAAMLPLDHVGRMTYAGSGFDPEHKLAQAFGILRAKGIDVDVLDTTTANTGDASAIVSANVPSMIKASTQSLLSWEVSVSSPSSLHLTFKHNNAVVWTDTLPVTSALVSTHKDMPKTPGVYELTAELKTERDVVLANNTITHIIEVLPQPKVLFLKPITVPSPVLAQVYREAGLEVVMMDPKDMPSTVAEFHPYSLVVMDEIEPLHLRESALQALKHWVREEAGGLIHITGDKPVRTTPAILRELEPVEPPHAIPEPRPMELVIVIDRSGSMSGEKMEQAKRAGIAAVGSLRQDSKVGAVAFSGAADRVIAPLPMERAQEVIRFIGSIGPGGGTNIAAALQAANRVMSDDPRYIHHVILLSDGESDASSAMAAAGALAGRGVSISAITIGPFTQLMADIARIGHGRYHVTENPSNLASLVVSEAMVRNPPAYIQSQFTPTIHALPQSLAQLNMEGAPSVLGHVLSDTKKTAQTILNGTTTMPLLAHWHFGNGQVATYTSSSTGPWANELRRWPGFRNMWAHIAKAMLRSKQVEPPTLSLSFNPLNEQEAILTVQSPYTDASLPPVIRLLNARGIQQLESKQLQNHGLGLWRVILPRVTDSVIDARMPFDPHPTVSIHLPKPRIQHVYGEKTALQALADAGSGQLISDLKESFDHPKSKEISKGLRPWLVGCALLFYLMSLLMRRWPEKELRGKHTVSPIGALFLLMFSWGCEHHPRFGIFKLSQNAPHAQLTGITNSKKNARDQFGTCPGYVNNIAEHTVDVLVQDALLSVHSQKGPLVLIATRDNETLCDNDKGSGHRPQLKLSKGSWNIFVGTFKASQSLPYKLEGYAAPLKPNGVTHQNTAITIQVDSQPSGAEVTDKDAHVLGVTPLLLSYQPKPGETKLLLHVSKEGLPPQSLQLNLNTLSIYVNTMLGNNPLANNAAHDAGTDARSSSSSSRHLSPWTAPPNPRPRPSNPFPVRNRPPIWIPPTPVSPTTPTTPAPRRNNH